MPTDTTKQVPNFVWPDGSAFCFDLPPRDVTGGWDNTVTGGIYDIPALPQSPFRGGYNGWTNWIDKAQKDYRFGAMSDENAVANLFPNVDDPWMFTEYVYEGTGKLKESDTTTKPVAIVEPPLVNPLRVTRTFNQFQIASTALLYTNDTYTTLIPEEPRYAFELEYQWQSKITPFTLFWESELDALGWVETQSGGLRNTEFVRTTNSRRRIRFQHPSNNAGVALNRVTMWSQATRWGQSQNIPSRVVTMTAPPDWFHTAERYTGRIVPHINVVLGQPIYDIAPQVGGMGTVRYEGVVVGLSAYGGKIGMKAVTIDGTNDGVPDAWFTYQVPTTWDGFSSLVLPQRPANRNSEPQYQWKEISFDSGALVHRGCAFWVGTGGTCSCQYASKVPPPVVSVLPYHVVASGASWDYNLPREIDLTTEELEVMVSTSVNGPWTKAATANQQVVMAYPTTDANHHAKIKLTNNASGAVMWAQVRIRIWSKNKARPHHLYCGFYDSQGADKQSSYRQQCNANNVVPCPFYTPKGPRIVATFEGVASNGAEWANMQRGLPQTQAAREPVYATDANGSYVYNPDGTRQVATNADGSAKTAVVDRPYKQAPNETEAGKILTDFSNNLPGLGAGGMVAGALAGAMARNIVTPDADLKGFDIPDRMIVDISFGPETVAIEGAQRYYDTRDGTPPMTDPESVLKLRRGTGYHVIDWKDEEAYTGVDTPFWGMVNQINYRIMHSVQHCFNASTCSDIIMGGTPAAGWTRGQYAHIDFTTHPLRMPGYPAVDASKSYCPYGDYRCPKTNLDRRAVEYDANYRVLMEEILTTFRSVGMAGWSTVLTEGFIDNTGTLQFYTQNQLASHATAICVAVRLDSDPRPLLIGHYQPKVKDAAGNVWRVYFYYDRPSWDPKHRFSHVMAHLIQFDANDQPCYITLTDSNDQTIANALFGDYTKVPWVVELRDEYVKPIGNPIFVTNPLPFAGGRHPEYRDLTKRGRQIMCEMGGYKDDYGRTGATDSNQFGGPLWNQAPMAGKSRMGYWTDKDGEFIIKAMPIASTIPLPVQPPVGGSPYVPVEARIHNKPGYYGGATPIKGVPNIAIQSTDPTDPDAINLPQSDYARVGHTYSSDTAALLAWFRELVPSTDEDGNPIMASRWSTMLPEDPNTGKKIQCSPPNAAPDMLPVERYYYRCTTCAVEFSQEEYNFFVAHVATVAPLPQNPPMGAQCGCPRRCGGTLSKIGVYDHFLDTRARGQVDFWGPPGTTVRRDGFAWKNPTLVSRIHYDQILRKLGNFHPVGGGYSFSAGFDPRIEGLGRLPVPIAGQFYNDGLAHQITAPWAAPGDTVRQVRDRLRDYFGLYDTDVVKFRSGVNGQIYSIPYANETTTIMSMGSVVGFYRPDPDDPSSQRLYPLGIPVSCTIIAAPQVMAEQIVQSDQPRPQRSSYPGGGQGDRLYATAISQWLVSVVQNSLYNWSTAANVGMSPNLLGMALTASGLPSSLAEGLDPSTGQTIATDERIIGPYATFQAGSLKMITSPYLKRLRNRVIPMLAYNLNDSGYTAGGDYTQTAQAGNTNRFQTIIKPLPTRKWGIIAPQILATNSRGLDYYVEWDTGDEAGTRARAYYPVGKTWWRMNQKVGQIKRHNGLNPLHLDDSTAIHTDPVTGAPTDVIPYTGDVVTSVCAMFLHGRIPMHMEVVKAFLIFKTEYGPSAAPIGCQGKYTGWVAPQFADGPHWGSAVFVGNTSCFFQHYHPFTCEDWHEQNWGGCVAGGAGYWNRKSKVHADYFVEYSLLNEFLDPHLTAEDPELPPSPVECSGSFDDQVEDSYLSWMGDDAQVNYFDQVSVLTVSFNDTSYGFDFTQPFLGALNDKGEVVSTWHNGQDLVQKKTEHEMWKDIDFSLFDALKSRYHATCEAAMNTSEAAITFDYFASEFRDQIFPREQQGISGWINYNGYDTSGRFGKAIGEEDKRVDTSWAKGPQVIVQADGGGNGVNQSGDAERILDVTKTVQSHYNDRVTRYFQCKLGWGFANLAVQIPKLTDTNLGLAKRFHTGYRDPQYFMNYRYVESGKGMWLNDPWHQMPLVNDMPVTPSMDGDPIVLSDQTKMGRIGDVSSWDTQGLTAADTNFFQYHPWQLCQASVNFIETSTNMSPVPTEVAGKYWRVISDRRDSQYFVVDLRSTPLETSRRPFRAQASYIDSSNATCPNTAGCFVAQNHWTVAQWYEKATKTWGSTTTPSTSSDKCANCGTPLVGVVTIPGDGITTVTYDPIFQDNPLVTVIQISADDGTTSSPRHGFVIEYFNSISQNWKVLFEVIYDATTGKYSYQQWSGTTWATVTATSLPASFTGTEGAGTNPKNATAATGAHFVAVAAAKLRYNVLQPSVRAMATPVDGSGNAAWGNSTPDATNSAIVVASLPNSSNLSAYIHRTVTLKDAVTNVVRSLTITDATAVTGGFKLALSGSLTANDTHYYITWTEYRTLCTKFRVYGWPYRKGDLIITPPPFSQPIYFGSGNTSFRLNTWASKVLKVEAVAGNRLGLVLTRVNSTTDPNFVWMVQQVNYLKPHLEVTGGAYYFDYTTNSVVIPDQYVDPTTNTKQSIWALNQTLYDDAQSEFDLPTMPRQLTVEYITGTGVAVDVGVEAVGNGPSYQLDRECVAFIARHGTDNESVPASIKSDPDHVLPNMGNSETLVTNNNQSCHLYWLAYNHDPIIWDTSVSWLVGDELGAGAWDDNSVLSVFSGGNGAVLADVGAGAALRGKATGTVTLYGLPNCILAGDLAVYAKAYTTRSYNLPGESQPVVTAERTGGYRRGAMVFRLGIADTVAAGRKGVMCSVPRLLVYLRERSSDPRGEASLS